jgi:undecaprenyl-diphosphatase
MSFLEVIILGIIQGITEFLPISSSGHLVIATHLFGLSDPQINLLLVIFLHLGSFIAILISFYDEIMEMFANLKVLMLVVIGTIPAGLIGFFFGDYISEVFNRPFLTGIGLLLTGIYLIASEWHWKTSPCLLEKATVKQAFLVGISQAFAILPGLSRSGLTIATGLFNGLERASAIKFSFLLAIPVMAGASLLKLRDFSKLHVAFQPIHILVGFVVCLLVSILAISILVKAVKRGHLSYFGWYCIIAGLVIIILI